MKFIISKAFDVVIWPLRSLYGLGGRYMALEVNIWPWDDLGGRPQMTSILVSARDKKFG